MELDLKLKISDVIKCEPKNLLVKIQIFLELTDKIKCFKIIGKHSKIIIY